MLKRKSINQIHAKNKERVLRQVSFKILFKNVIRLNQTGLNKMMEIIFRITQTFTIAQTAHNPWYIRVIHVLVS